ncbi:MAG: PAS domain S-box protein [Acidimicrobiales bacterium]
MSEFVRLQDGSLTTPRAALDTEFDPRVIVTVVYGDNQTPVDFEFAAVNTAAAHDLGFDVEQLIGRHYRDVDPHATEHALWGHLVRVAETGETLELAAYPHQDWRSGETITLDLRAGRVGDVLSISWRNVTERTRLLERYRLVAENASDVVFQTDLDTRIRWASPSSHAVLGWTPLELEGIDAVDLLHPDDTLDVPRWSDELERLHVTNFEARLRCQSGTYSHFAITVREVTSDAGVTELIGSIHNIDLEVTQRQRAQLLSERYQLIAENSLDVVVVGSPDGRIVWIFDTVYQLLGWCPNEMIGHFTDEFIHPDDLANVKSNRSAMLDGARITTEVRMRRADGTYRWLSISGRDVPDESGTTVTRIVSWRDADAEVAQRTAVAASEAQYRLLAENASDVIWRTDVPGRIEWVSPSVTDVLGWPPDALVGRLVSDLLGDDEDVTTRSKARQAITRGERVASFECHYRTASGGLRWMRTNLRGLVDESGRLNGIIASLQDIEALVQRRRAFNALAMGNAILVRAVSDRDLLNQLCQNLVDEGGYLFAWYGRLVNDEDQSIGVIASSREHRDYLDSIKLSWGDNEFGQGPAGRSLRVGETFFVNDLATSVAYQRWSETSAARGFRSSIGIPVFVNGFLDGSFSVYAAETNAFDVPTVTTLEELALQVGIGLQRLREQERLARALHESNLLNTAIGQAAEAVLVTDATGQILYANPATTATSGYTTTELIGSSTSMFASGVHGQDFYRELWSSLNRGQSWHGVITNRRKNGELYDEETTISPVFGDASEVMAYVAVKRDLSVERQLEAHVDRGNRDAQDLANLMREVRPSGSLEATAAAFCQALLRLNFIDAAALFVRRSDENFIVGGSAGVTLTELEPGRTVEVLNPTMFLARSVEGAWWVDLAEAGDFVNEPLVRAIRSAGIEAVTIAPVRWDGEIVGLLATGARDRASVPFTPSRLPLYEELGSFAGGLIGSQAETARYLDATKTMIHTIIDAKLFHPVFQPVVALDDGSIVGYEALTRFKDGQRPDEHFAIAASVDMGVELEVACARAAVHDATRLPSGSWLSLNFSPTVAAGERAHGIIVGADRAVAIEITEHARIDNFDEIRRAVASVSGCQLFVDDAGAGYAGLHHILELRPDVVKLDISLVRDIDHDPARQALVSGMRHFADLTGTRLLGEGIETAAEAETLRSLGVDLGQGYYFGRPARVEDLG